MKKILATILVVVATVMSGSAQNYKEYRIGINKINISNVEDTSICVLIKRGNDFAINLSSIFEIDRFVSSMKQVYEKSFDWYTKAKMFDIDSVTKEMPIDFGDFNIVYENNNYKLSPTITFWYKKDGTKDNLLILVNFHIQNHRIRSIMFISFEQFNEFMSLLDSDNINDIVNQMIEEKILIDNLFN